MPTWLCDASAGAAVGGWTDNFGNRNQIPTNAECMADPGLVVHRVQTLVQNGEDSKPWSRCCCQKKRCLWKLLQPSGISLVTPIFSWSRMAAADTRRATDVPWIRVQTCRASYVVLRRYLPKLQSHQEAPMLLSSRFCQREAD